MRRSNSRVSSAYRALKSWFMRLGGRSCANGAGFPTTRWCKNVNLPVGRNLRIKYFSNLPFTTHTVDTPGPVLERLFGFVALPPHRVDHEFAFRVQPYSPSYRLLSFAFDRPAAKFYSSYVRYRAAVLNLPRMRWVRSTLEEMSRERDIMARVRRGTVSVYWSSENTSKVHSETKTSNANVSRRPVSGHRKIDSNLYGGMSRMRHVAIFHSQCIDRSGYVHLYSSTNVSKHFGAGSRV